MIKALRGALLFLSLYGLANTPLASLAQSAAGAGNNPVDVVKVEGGLVKGVPSDTQNVQVFKGIPFAALVGDENRWKPPMPVEPWKGVMVADKWGDRALQDTDGDPDEPPVSENGLNLNVFTPAQSANAKLPVYMLIHGGANRTGANSERDIYAAELAAKGIVVVSVQYRLGAFGFMALPEMAEENPEGVAGNYGLLDLVKALEWIDDNIAGFGGDPETVTIGGQSAGAENVTALLRTPRAREYFDRAFISSGFTGFLPGKYVRAEEKLKQNKEAVDKIFGRGVTLAELRAITAEEYLEPWKGGQQSLARVMNDATARSQFYNIDGIVITEESYDLMRPGALQGLDIMIGSTADEYTGLGGDPEGTLTPEEFDRTMRAPRSYGKYGHYDDEYAKHYRPDTDLDAYRLSRRSTADKIFASIKISSEYAKAHNQDLDVWTFYWDHAPPGRNEGFHGAYHAADLYYFNASLRDEEGQRKWTDPDYRMRDLATNYLANFIKTGNPNGERLPEWGQTTPESGGQFMRFHQGYAYLVNETPYPSRDRYNRRIIMEANGLTEEDIAN
ncbi:carboxylesterase/lipase family protein [Chelativorans xinjiangense]|uniref:carboxylesterase/lipase family protein n=1 Tax=Chelativorans xinjiangense TaxID=2681485 RepID=UPI001359090D|nr:carboxylesterase family protein [Chelativorans xinjiangense]